MSEYASIGQILEERAKKNQKKTALFFEGKEISYDQLNGNVNKLANGLKSLGIAKGDRVAIMLPNIPEFVYSFFAIQKISAVAVPFNTMYKGREVTHILNDSGARAIIALTNFGGLLNEIKPDVPALEHIILTGERTLLFVQPESTVSVQMVYESSFFNSVDEAYNKVGEILVEVFKKFGVDDAWYKHRGSVRVKGRKIASFIVSSVENLSIINAICFMSKLATDEFFKVIWVPPEVKDKVIEPLTSVEEITCNRPDNEEFKNVVTGLFGEMLGIEIEEGKLKRDEIFGYEKQRALAFKA
ncbi:MAG TPA: acyl-CoA synthetase [Spirochaetes bacterium]|nr:acyl-CoA synthetase [Spirochaetota bacterium]